MSERDELAHILDVQGAQVGDCGHEPGEADDCENGCRELLLGYADAILAAGYRKPRVVSTVEELEALPVGSAIVVRGEHIEVGVIATRVMVRGNDDEWESYDAYETTEGLVEYLPATVLFEPTEKETR